MRLLGRANHSSRVCHRAINATRLYGTHALVGHGLHVTVSANDNMRNVRTHPLHRGQHRGMELFLVESSGVNVGEEPERFCGCNGKTKHGRRVKHNTMMG